MQKLNDFSIQKALESTACEKTVYPAEGEEKFNVVMINYGALKSTVKQFTAKGCKITALPYTATAEEVLALNPDGIILSQGAGDPAENTACIETVKALSGKKPIFAVGLGHQIFAIAMGAKTQKMLFGHHGASQPVKCIECGKVLITSQNHGYTVVTDTLPKDAVVTHINVNDATAEGIKYPALCAFTLQFNMDASDKFCKMMEEKACH